MTRVHFILFEIHVDIKFSDGMCIVSEGFPISFQAIVLPCPRQIVFTFEKKDGRYCSPSMSDVKEKRRVAILGSMLSLLTPAIFWQLVHCDFVNFDDNLYVTDNIHVRAGLNWDTIRWAFTSTVASNWHPLTWISHALDFQLYGLQPAGHHLTNLLFHTANAVLLFIWLWRLTGAVWHSALVAALFAWHPLHVESVAWVAERKDVLSTFFLMLTLLSHERFKVRGLRFKVWYALALVFFVLGLLAKPMLVTLPFVLLLVDFWNGDKNATMPISKLPWNKWVVEKIPFFALSAASCAVTFYAQKTGGAVQSFEHLSPGERLKNAIVSYCLYIGKTFWPKNLAVFYPQTSREAWEVAGAAIVLLTITFFVATQINRRRYLALGWFWFLGTLVPVIGIIQVGGQSMADRYSYVPLIGLFIMLVWGLAELAAWSNRRKEAIGVACVALAGCGWATSRQTSYWRDSESLFKHDIQVAGPTVVVCSNLGTFLMTHNRSDEALSYFTEALNIAPNLASTHSNVGFVLIKTGKTDEGIQQLQKALELDPNLPDAHYNLGAALLQQGKLLARQQATSSAVGRYREAVRQFREALRAKPDFLPALNDLAWLLASSPHAEIRNGTEAVTLAQHACEVTSWKYAQLIGTLAAARAEAGQFEEAAKTADRARSVALATGDKHTASINEELSKIYHSGKAYHESD